MFGTGITFRAQIKKGAAISHDFGYFRWPKCKAPGGRSEASNADMVFEAEVVAHYFDLRASGYGAKSHYGNGSIGVHKIDDLIIDESDRDRVLAHFRAEKKKQIDKATGDLVRLSNEMAALTSTERGGA